MLLSYDEALDLFGSRGKLRSAVNKGEIYSVARGVYSTDDDLDAMELVGKFYPDATVTGLTALYVHGLIDTPPGRIDVATKRGGTKIANPAVAQHFVPVDWISVGRVSIEFDGREIPVYDCERMLIELMRSRNKYPRDLYKDAIRSFRERANSLDMCKLDAYAAVIPRGQAYLDRAFEEVF